MQTVDANGSQLTPKLFINIFRDVVKLSPARFLTLRIHTSRYNSIYTAADVPESIQVGYVLAPMGRQVLKVNCVKPPMGVTDGITIIKDDKTDPSKMVFEIHGVPELIVVNLGS